MQLIQRADVLPPSEATADLVIKISGAAIELAPTRLGVSSASRSLSRGDCGTIDARRTWLVETSIVAGLNGEPLTSASGIEVGSIACAPTVASKSKHQSLSF
jgi:hypothetical protein